MRLERFTGESIHGFLNLDIKFFSDLTFLIGINGCGKTTALDAIIALITPSFLSLGRLDFKTLKIYFENLDEHHFVEATRDGNAIILRTSAHAEEPKFSSYISDPEAPSYREPDMERDYYRDLFTKQIIHPVVNFIYRLPTPMFLGLNRRAAADDVRPLARGHDPRTFRPRRNIFSGSLSQGVLEAISLAENQHRDSLIEVGKAGDKLRRDMLIELLTVEKRSFGGALSVPTTREPRQIPEMRRAIDPLAIVLGLPRETVSQKVGAFLDVLEESSKRIPAHVNVDRALGGSNDGDSSTTIDAIINWNINLPGNKKN